MTFMCHLIDDLFLFRRKCIAVLLLNLGYDPCVQQLLDIVPCRVQRSVLAADRLPLYCQLNILVCDLFTHRSVKPLCLTFATCGWAAAAVKKNKVDDNIAGDGR